MLETYINVLLHLGNIYSLISDICFYLTERNATFAHTTSTFLCERRLYDRCNTSHPSIIPRLQLPPSIGWILCMFGAKGVFAASCGGHLDSKATLAAADRLLIRLPLVGPARLGDVDVFLPAEALP